MSDKSEYADEGCFTKRGIYWRSSLMVHSEQWCSNENGVAVGTVRMIGRRFYHAWTIRRRKFAKDEVIWAPIDLPTKEAKP